MATPDRLLDTLRIHLNAWRYTRSERETGGIVRLLAKVSDPDMRLRRFAEHLRSRTPDEAAWSIATLFDLVENGDARARAIGLDVLNSGKLIGVLSRGEITVIADALRRRNHPAADLFGDNKARIEAEEAAPPSEPVGYRISLARRALEGSIDRLLFDSDPRVVRTLLGNPRLTEADVVKLAASRRAIPECLELIAQDSRWVGRYPVKVALASNPLTPTRIVVSLLPYLLHQDIRMIMARDTRTEVRRHISGMLSWRPDT